MRIGINGRFLAAPVTGVQRFAHEVVRRLAARHDVVLFLDRNTPTPQFACETVRGERAGQFWERSELPTLAARHCDVLLHPANTGVRARVPHVLVLHDVLPLLDPRSFTAAYLAWVRWTVPAAARTAARVVTVSAASRRAICRATGAAPGRVLIAPQGLAPFDTPASPAEVAAVRTRYGLPDRYLLAVGTDARKNVGFLRALLPRWPAAPLLVCAGEVVSHVHVSQATSAPHGAVRMLGRVPDADLRALYTGALALCAPSLDEGFGRVPLEAIACGAPALVAPYSAAAETVAGLRAARVLPLHPDAWLQALQHLDAVPRPTPDEQASLRAKWSWDAAADVVVQACTEAIAELRVTPRVRSLPAERSAVQRVAIVHDWLTGMRGGERVLRELLALHPAADVFTLVHVPGSVPEDIARRVVAESFVDRLPFAHRAHRLYLPLYPAAVQHFDLSGYDLVISSSHCAAKAVRTTSPHLCYCHTPMRYLWDRQADYFGAGRARLPLRLAARALVPVLRRWDVRTAARPDRLVANSQHVRARIRTCWQRDAAVVHPPVDIDRFRPALAREDYHVVAGALVPYKRVDLAIDAFNLLRRPLRVIGDGPEYRRLRARAGRTIEFLGAVSDEELALQLAPAQAFIAPMVEDFGILPVEAQAAGTPVIAYAAGGALETVVDHATGLFFTEHTAASLAAAVRAADTMVFDSTAIRAHAARFHPSVFRAGMTEQVRRLLAEV